MKKLTPYESSALAWLKRFRRIASKEHIQVMCEPLGPDAQSLAQRLLKDVAGRRSMFPPKTRKVRRAK